MLLTCSIGISNIADIIHHFQFIGELIGELFGLVLGPKSCNLNHKMLLISSKSMYAIAKHL